MSYQSNENNEDDEEDDQEYDESTIEVDSKEEEIIQGKRQIRRREPIPEDIVDDLADIRIFQ